MSEMMRRHIRGDLSFQPLLDRLGRILFRDIRAEERAAARRYWAMLGHDEPDRAMFFQKRAIGAPTIQRPEPRHLPGA